MTEQKPDAGDLTPSSDDPTTLLGPEETTSAEPAEPPLQSDAGTSPSDGDPASEVAAAESGTNDPATTDDTELTDDAAADGTSTLADGTLGTAATAGAAWTTTPVAPDPEATEAALAALAAKPEMTIEPPEPPPPPPLGSEPPEEGTPILLVGGILIGAFIVALAIVLILFRPFDSAVVTPSPSPSPVLTEVPSESPQLVATVDTPNFQGLSLEDAEQTAEDYGLVVRAIAVETSNAAPGVVISQEPGPGEAVEEGSTIELSVAVAPETVPVPDIVELPEAEALEALEDAGLLAGDRSEASSEDVAAGAVISQDPEAASEVAPDSEVDYVVSSGPETVPVPDIVELPEAEALEALEDAGLLAGDRSEASSEDVAAGAVISQDPEAASEVAPDSEVDYVVSSGPETVPVPDIVELPEAEALEALEDAGLLAGDRSEASSEDVAAGAVISQDPEAASEVAPDSEVDYVVSSGPETVPVPDIVELPEAEALEALEDAGLLAGDRSEASSEDVAAGAVISQDPDAASEVAPDSEVDYVVSSGPAIVELPDFVGLTLEEAEAAAAVAGVIIATVDQESMDADPGTILGQDPASGSPVAVGSTVTLTLAVAPELVAVPDLSGAAADAEASLDEARLVVGEVGEAYSEDVPAGDVISQDPAAGSEVAPGSAVDYVSSLGPELVAVPDLSGAAADAEASLDEARLVVGEVGEAYSEDVPAGDVISQDPAAGSEVAPGSAVDYVSSLGPELVAVPDLSGAAADAEASLDEARLVVGEVGEAYSEDVPAGDVISQDPAAGSEVAPGSAVDYVSSLGPELVAVPDLSGAAADAEASLDEARLVVGEVGEAYSEDVPAGDVISQDPAAGSEVAPGSAVDYVSSLGPELVAVPDLSGAAADAEASLDEARLVVGEVGEAYSEDVPAGDVISQDPAAGSEVAPGSAVDYVSSLGPELVAVPDLSGAAADAEASLDEARLVVGEVGEAYSEDVPAGDVISQDPAAGSEVAPGSAVDYVSSLGPELVAVPDLSGAAADAEASLDEARLVVGEVGEAYSEDVPAGDVISQDPAAGSEVAPGSAVDYVSSLGPELVAVPDLSGAAADAEASLDEARLVVGEVGEAYSEDVPAGDVISQDPAAGSEVAPGSAVDYVSSLGPELVAVPDLSGAAADAEASLDEARLVVGEVGEAYSEDVPAGDVISQDPAAGSEVAPGSAVDYVSSLGPELVAVPDLSGAAADAEASLDEARLVVGEVGEAYSEDVPAGDVISQDPAAGSEVAPGSAVDYVSSLGPELVAVPDLSGAAADAEASLDEARLVVGEVGEAYSEDVPAGDVISQDPAAGSEVAPGSAVDYVSSLGPELVAVPDLSGAAADAEASLDEARLVVGEVGEAYSEDVPAGDVISQDPAAGSEVAPGSAVDYVSSLGPELVAVPDLSGAAADAEASLDEARLVVGEVGEAYSEDVPAGDVISQDPAAGSEVAPGSAVDYVSSLGPELVAVPDLSGAAADAEASLDEARLVVGEVGEAYSEDVPAGDVISQDPAAGSEVAPGSAVDYVSSLGAIPDVLVPAVRNMPEADAVTAVEAAGLIIGEIISEGNDNVAAGDAIRTDPPEGSEVPAGTAVALTISSGPSTVTVPEVRDTAAAEAQSTLQSAGLIVTTEERTNAQVAAGDAVKTDPAAGTEVAAGSDVLLTISRGPKPVTVPDVVGSLKGAATTTLTEAGLSPGEESVVADPSPRNTVLTQDPAAGSEVPAGTAVALTISSGPSTVTVPEVRDTAAAEAQSTLQSAGLIVTTEERTNAQVAAGDAVKTDPAAGTEVAAGSDVLLTISRGPKPVTVPDVVGSLKGAATTTLTEAGLSPGEESVVADPSPRNTVLTQDPAAGSEVPAGTAVALTISSGPSTVTVPEVRDTAAAEAQSTLQSAGLIVTTEERTNAQVAAGDAVKTDPAAGTEVAAGSDVLLTISRGPKPVTVPDVVGSLKGAATTTLTEAGLSPGEESVVADPSPRNTVLTQDPAAGSEVPAGTAVALTISSGPSTVTVPEVRDTAAAEAQSTLQSAGLIVTTEERTNAQVAAGDAVKTDPAAGTEVAAGSDVLLTISRGPKPVTVPDVVGSLKGAATTTLTEAGLSPGEESVVADPSPRNTVLTQDPAAGSEVPAGTAVALTISSGPSTVTVPEVRDTAAAEAQSTLQSAGLIVTTEERTNAQVAAGDAVKTDPAAGTEVAAGSDVLLTISRGPKPVTVPDVVGSLKGAATTTLTEAGLSPGEESVVADPSPRNTVLTQDPAAGSEVPAGTAVALTISSGPSTVTVPEVRDTAAAEAQSTLQSAGLIVTTEERTNAQVAAGDAVKTDPAAGTEVAAGSDVLLTISRGPKPVTVPDVVGSLKGAATTTLTEAGLSPGEESVVADPSPRNTVLTQDPAAGSEVPAGTAVALTISSGPSTVTVPEVRDTAAAEAQSTLQSAGLIVTTEERTNAQVAAGDAVKTDPAAGTEVAAGSDVLLTISRGPKPVTVPDVVGSLKGAATTTLTEAGLSPGEESVVADPSPRNTVLTQDPAAGSEVPAGTAVALTISSGPSTVTVPEVRDTAAAEAQSTLQSAGLIVTTEERTNAQVAAGDAVKTDPAAGSEVAAGSDVLLTISRGPKPVTVPDVVGLAEPDAMTAFSDAELAAGERTETVDDAPAGTIVSHDPPAGTEVTVGTAIDYVVSLGPPAPSRGEGGSLENATVIDQLDEVADSVPALREMELGNTPYDGANRATQESLMSERSAILYDPDTIRDEEAALTRLGLLGADDDLAALLDELYGQNLPIGYLEQRGRQSILQSIEQLDVAQRSQAAREFGRAAVLDAFGADAARVEDSSDGDRALAALALEQGDGTATMLDWAAATVSSGEQDGVDDVVVPGRDEILASMPQLLQREYSFPFLEGRTFVGQLRKDGGWDRVNDAWGRLPESTEQVMHPNLYGADRPTSIDMDAIAGRLGGGWSEAWQQTMGELRIGVWLADGQPGTQNGPRAPVKLPKANAAAGWGGDRLVSLDGPDGSWAIVWQTKWDRTDDIAQFTNAANAAIADLPGAHAVLDADVSAGASNPALVLLTSDGDTLATVAEALGIASMLPEE